MPKDQILMGVSVAVLSVVGLLKSDWLLQYTRKGRWLVRKTGERNAKRIVQSFFVLFALFGVLLAANVVQPVQW